MPIERKSYPIWDGVEMKPGIRVYISDRDHPAWDIGGAITDVRGGPGTWEFAVSIDGPNGIRNTPDWLPAYSVGLDDDDAFNAPSAREWRSARRLKVFLCHGSEDKPRVRALYQRLKGEGMKPWLDEEDISPGQEWAEAIQEAVRASHAVLVCLSQSSTGKAGYVQKEIKFALDRADEMPEGRLFVIPVKLEECEIPRRLTRWQWVKLWQDTDYEKLIATLKAHAVKLELYTLPERP